MTFEYQARNFQGGLVNGTMDAEHEQLVIEILGSKDLVVVSLKPVVAKGKRSKKKRSGRVSLSVLATFTSQLATMLRAGLALVSCLDSLARQVKDRVLQSTLKEMVAFLENGSSLSEALAQHEGVFPSLYVNIVKAGENSGALPEMLNRLASYLERSLWLRQKVRSAMTYPAIVSVMGAGICIFLVTKIIPVFVDIFKEFNHQLPLPTLILIQTSTLIRSHLLTFLGLVTALVMGLRRLRRTAAGARVWDHTKLHVPLFGQLSEKIAMSRFSRTFATLAKSGVPVLQNLDIVAGAVSNVIIEKAIHQARVEIERGSTMLVAMERQNVFPPMLLEMVAAGEQSGAVDEMLVQVADHYDREIETTLAGLTSLIEPLMILFLGLVVGSVVVAMFLPIFRMTEAVQF